jgi:replicative DNA helicase
MSTVNGSEIYWKDYIDSLDIERDINEVCNKCRAKQIRDNGKITISCRGMMKIGDVIDPADLSYLTEEEKQSLEKEINPFLWAKSTFVKEDGTPLISERFYQEQLTRCSAKRRVFRCGRRTGKSYAMAILIAEALLRNSDYRVLVVTPYDVQAEEIFLLVKQLLSNVKGIPASEIIERAVSSPTHFIKLKNGSRVRGFTTGSSGAGSVRGQGADEIFIDEIDYMSEKDFNSVMAILADAPDTKLTVASTPDGEKMLYKLSRTPTYKEFHFPTFVLPHYSDELDQDLRDTTDGIGYIQEFMAEFGVSRSSVFQKVFINKAMKNEVQFTIDDVLRDRSQYVLALGCDWNHVDIGTKICLSAMHTSTQVISPVAFESVSKEGWTQTSAMDKIIEINREFRPEHIYLDEGFGYAQIEMLKRFAIEKRGKTSPDNPDLRLADIVGVNFSSSIKIRDPKTGDEKSRFVKQYMVENAVNFFENDMISLNTDRDKTLEAELTTYIEKSRTPTGRIVYAASNAKIGDHNLDAFMLSLYALHMEYSDLFRRTGMAATIVHTGPTETPVSSNRRIMENKDLSYFSEPIRRANSRTGGLDKNSYARPGRGRRTEGLVSNRWSFN